MVPVMPWNLSLFSIPGARLRDRSGAYRLDGGNGRNLLRLSAWLPDPVILAMSPKIDQKLSFVAIAFECSATWVIHSRVRLQPVPV
jgi:hypothetical protein